MATMRIKGHIDRYVTVDLTETLNESDRIPERRGWYIVGLDELRED